MTATGLPCEYPLAFMASLLQLTAGSEVRCTDGRVGHVRGLMFDPQARSVTHLSVDASNVMQNGRIVPLASVRSAGSAVELDCAREDYYKFPEDEALDSAIGGGPSRVTVIHVHLVPHGETELTDSLNVHATDGRAGHLAGAAVDQDSQAVRELLVNVGHFSGRHQVSIPIDAVATVDEHGVHLRLSKDELSRADSGLT